LDDDVFSRFQDVLEVKELRRVDPEGLSEIFQERCNSSGLEVAEIIHDYGEEVRETRQKLGHNRIYSYNHRVGEFLSNFFEKDSDRYLHLAHKDRRDRANMEVRCFDGRALTDPVLREAKGSILMSGFLSPIEVYRDLTLYDEKTTHLKEFNSPFPSENRLILVAKGISSRFKERTYATIQRWKEYIEAILEANQGNTAVFSTSYNLMHTILKQIETSRNVIVEKPKTRRQTLLKQLSRTSQNALFGVMGGKFSEGIDYPGKLLTCVVAVGLPYATWDVYQSAMISYYNKRYPERGRLHAYITPAILRLVQACGRVHRSERDKGCIAILDERVINPKIKQLLPNYFQKEMKIISNPNEALNQIEEFWREHYNFN
jgi:DNA excision repair protein ERCC-2